MKVFTVNGSFKHMESFLSSVSKLNTMALLDSYGREGVSALARATPVESGLAAASWGYKASKKGGLYTLAWTNHDIENGFPVVIALQYGYGTGTGGYIQGRDFINPAIRPVFDKIANGIWKAVTSA